MYFGRCKKYFGDSKCTSKKAFVLIRKINYNLKIYFWKVYIFRSIFPRPVENHFSIFQYQSFQFPMATQNFFYNFLYFAGPFNHAVTSNMRLNNPTDNVILFKIKTTAPKKYCVRPNCGSLEAGASAEVYS